ncbi:hypothetical protein CONLIGDRAFT_137197 [Coniochaeta ligniaria NRRL 30616]|uniref:Uncharacterized protein n=1 Tax=Coniochaeta ligniaria NRRL 30616 TaxID=1408157 RepID=A0A1J7I8D4_9PEZI|nr:hypothetical protein CONLIGDRAFT_137197 [Coniochaeta ligniaria NRRL 30616]
MSINVLLHHFTLPQIPRRIVPLLRTEPVFNQTNMSQPLPTTMSLTGGDTFANASQCASSLSTPNGIIGLSPEFYGTLAAVIPAIAYPFMPSDGRLHCEFILEITIMTNVTIHFLNMLCWFGGVNYTHFQPWVFRALVFATWLVYQARITSEHIEEAAQHPNDFLFSNYETTAFAAWYFFGYVTSFMGSPAISLQNAACLIIMAIGCLYWDFVLAEGCTRVVSLVFCRLGPRSVPGWFWLGSGEFAPSWSNTIAWLVTISAPILLCLWAAAMATVMLRG